MRRLAGLAALIVGLPLALVFGLGADGGGDGYRVRAIFDNVAAAVPGEDVKVAGARVGEIESMDVTPENKAAVVLKIDDMRFAPFRANAKCTVRPQSLIGEKFVECQPGTAKARPLDRIDDGAGEGQYALPVENTSSPVDLDLVNDILRRPYRERLSILLNEFGTGLAGRGKDLNDVIHRANPALHDTDRVLAILARQNRVLAKLATDSDQVLAPLAREKEKVGDFVVQANTTAAATAERRADIERSIRDLPGFLEQVRPAMADLGSFAGQAEPVARDLNAAAPDVSRLIRQLGPFSTAAGPAIKSLGKATATGRPALVRTRPLVKDLRSFAANTRPLASNLNALTTSLDKTGGVERIMDYLFFQTLAINGFDGIGHYLRAGLLVNLCSTYAIAPATGCNANFTDTKATGSAANVDPHLADARAALSGKTPSKGGGAKSTGGAKGSVPASPILNGLLGNGQAESRKNSERIRRQAQKPSPSLQDKGGPVLDYLLGSDEK
jgi:virulence factor Mce-like protein